MNYFNLFLYVSIFSLNIFVCSAQKPNVWIFSDMSDKTLPGTNSEGTINDPDDISAMAGYLLMCNEFNTLGIVVASTHRSAHKTTPDQGAWANQYFGTRYRSDVVGLNASIGGFPADISFMQSCIKVSSEKFSNSKTYSSISGYSTIKAFYDTVVAQKEIVNVLCWGSLTEPAIFVKHCITTGNTALLKKVRFIAHWTNSTLHQGTVSQPWKVANCNEDLDACNYLKSRALARDIDYYECGAIGQHGIVSGQPKGESYYNQFKVSKIGEVFATGKFAYNGVDHSDAATYWVLLENWGVKLSDINPNGTNPGSTELANETKFKNKSTVIHNELLRRARASQTSSIVQQQTSKNISVRRNESELYVDVKNDDASKYNFCYYSISGQLLIQKKLENGSNTITLPNVKSGFYVAEIKSQSNKYIQKMVIN